jgi:hypothetical protein
MIWMFIAAIVVGVLTGLALRAAAVVILTGILALASFAYLAFSGYSILGAAVIAFGLLAAVQLSYFAGLLLSAVLPEKWRTKTFCRRHCGAAVYSLAYAGAFCSVHG